MFLISQVLIIELNELNQTNISIIILW